MPIRTALLAFLCAAGVARAEPSLWMVKSPSATIYLLGVVHAVPTNFPWLDSRIRRALAQSDEVWTETVPAGASENTRAIFRYGYSSGPTLMSLLPPHSRTQFEREMTRAGYTQRAYQHMRPWLADLLLTRGAVHQVSVGAHPGVEATLLGYARSHHLGVFNFETVDEQLAIFDDLPDGDQIAALTQDIDAFDPKGDELNVLIDAWLAGNETLLDEQTNGRLQASSQQTWTEIILRRNGEFAKKIAERLQDAGTVFVALGAAHLCGSDSVQALLQNYGYEATLVPANRPVAVLRTRPSHGKPPGS